MFDRGERLGREQRNARNLILSPVSFRGQLTSSTTRAHGAVAGALCVAADVADAGVQQALAAKVLAVHVLDAPEASGGQGALLRAVGDVHFGGLFGGETQGGGCEGPGQLLEDRAHYRGAEQREQ